MIVQLIMRIFSSEPGMIENLDVREKFGECIVIIELLPLI